MRARRITLLGLCASLEYAIGAFGRALRARQGLFPSIAFATLPRAEIIEQQVSGFVATCQPASPRYTNLSLTRRAPPVGVETRAHLVRMHKIVNRLLAIQPALGSPQGTASSQERASDT
jgi:hypothetical protein